ncbi:MAG: 5-(carboxyamino)imidazole ribonucleotide mutase [Chloroflexi bacterium CG07_land_8_20_14_0_80_45_17]|nr:MAG: 5-(carboxyamino)imidazole ribonucleotide mutase [Chloroflexi bacterium CG23_combo_of_CG06-09_8_20_14_all_45_10]PIU56088.1 MAG: 5-(carboxyamino)imidazole ribonucleotide mutase [Chloroflexi bacterium CG07_land_8_20_14_0_80_45_17]
MAKVGIVMGSKTDRDIVKPAMDMLEQLGIDYEVSIISAHRNPEKLREYGLKAEERGFEVIIAAAGGAAHLPGILASWTTLPVIGIPLPTTELKGVDALLSIAQMPAGVPVACVGIGTSGAKNAALLAAQILGIKHEEVKEAYQRYKAELAEK